MWTDDDLKERKYESVNIDMRELESRLGKIAHPLLSDTYDVALKPSHQIGILKTYKNLVLNDTDVYNEEVKDELSNLRKMKENIDTQNGVKRYINAQKSLLHKELPSDRGFMYVLEKKKKKKKAKDVKAVKAVKEVEEVQQQIKTKKIKKAKDPSPDDRVDFLFATEEECKSAKRSKPYYTQKTNLIDIISKNAKLKPQFPKISKMSKDEICEKLFEVAREN